VSGVYGANSYSARRVLWFDLNYLQGLWCVLGDFNGILSTPKLEEVLPNNLSCAEFHY